MAAEDPRLLPRWHFAVIGCLVTLALLLVRSHVLMIAVALWLVAASVILGSFGTHVPPWAVVVIACTVGVVAAVLLRRSELLRIAGTRHLEDG